MIKIKKENTFQSTHLKDGEADLHICVYKEFDWTWFDRYAANQSMDNYAFANADGDFLIIPQEGSMCHI